MNKKYQRDGVPISRARYLRERGLFTVLAYWIAANNQAAGVTADSVAIPDSNFSIRNNHFIFTEQYELKAATAFGATLTAAQIFDPTLNAINIPQIYPVNAAGIIPPTNPNVMDLRDAPIALPQNEEIQINLAGGAGGAEPDYGLIWIRASGGGAPDYPIMPPSLTMPRVRAIFTATIVLTAGVWSPFVGITFTNPLKGGAYQVNSCMIVCAHSIAFKINFVKAPLYQGRKMYPGSLVENAYGNIPVRSNPGWMGGYGRFNNFELPQISVLGSTTEGSATYTGYMDLTYLGNTNADAMP